MALRTAPKLIEAVKVSVVEMAGRGVKFRNRKVGIEGVIGAAMLHYVGLSADEQEALLREMLPRIEAMFAQANEKAVPEHPALGPGEISLGSGGKMTAPDFPKKSSKKGRRA